MEKKIHVASLEDLKRLTSKIASCLKGNEIITLKGNLGSGKTTFVRFLIDSLGGNQYEVSSPTFTIMNEYDTEKGKVYHLDLYRLDSFDITDIVGEGIIIIEWPKEDYSEYGFPVIEVDFEITGEESRQLTVRPIYQSRYILSCV